MENKFTNMSHTDRMETGEVYDEADQAQMRQLNEIQELTKEPLFKPEYHPNFNGFCMDPDCGDELPIERIQRGRIYCTTCQELREKRQKR